MTDLERKVLNLLKYHKEQHPGTYRKLNEDLRGTGVRAADIRVLCEDFMTGKLADVNGSAFTLTTHDPSGSGMIYDGSGPAIELKITTGGLRALEDDANAVRSIELGARERGLLYWSVGLGVASALTAIVTAIVAIMQLNRTPIPEPVEQTLPEQTRSTGVSATQENPHPRTAPFATPDTAKREVALFLCGPCDTVPSKRAAH